MRVSNQYKLVLAYDGTDFEGWQVQKNGRSIANCIERLFKAVFKQEIHLVGASRTDAGVHAYGQVATFVTDLVIPVESLQRALQAALPTCIVIRSCQQVPRTFHPRYDVHYKIYHYTLYVQQPMPWIARYGYFPEDPFDANLLQQALNLFLGTHDFRSFCSGNEYRSTVRTIDQIELLKENDKVVIVFKAQGFLRYMIRRLVGAALDVASGKVAMQNLIKALQ